MMDCISENKQRENLISQFKEFCECAYDEFGDDIDCQTLLSSALFERTFSEMYAIVDDCCTLEIKQKVASFVDVLQSENSISFYELESEINFICELLEKMSFRDSYTIENGVYLEKNYNVNDIYGGVSIGHSTKNDSPKESTHQVDEKEQEDIDALILYVKQASQNLGLYWQKNELLESISANGFALTTYNNNPYAKRSLDADEIIEIKTFFAPFNLERCKSELSDDCEDEEEYSFNDEEDKNDYDLFVFVSLITKTGEILNSLSLLGIQEDGLEAKQLVNGYYLYASEDSDDQILENIVENIDEFAALPEVDTEDLSSIQKDIDRLLSLQAFYKFFRIFLGKCQIDLGTDLIEELDEGLNNINKMLRYRTENAMDAVKKNLMSIFELAKEQEDNTKEVPTETTSSDPRVARLNSDKVFILNIDSPKFMNFSTGEDGFVVYFDIDNKTNRPLDLTLSSIFIYANGRQWASNYDYTGFGFSHEEVDRYASKKVGKIWINESWKQGLVEDESYLTATFEESNITYFFKYMYQSDKWSLYDYYELEK